MTDKIDTSAPERIWLQTDGDYAEAREAMIGTDTGVTWCDTQVNEGDQGYVRRDLYDAIVAERDELIKALKPFAAVPKHGAHGGPLVCADVFYEDGSALSRAPLSPAFGRPIPKEAFEMARAALRQDEGGK